MRPDSYQGLNEERGREPTPADFIALVRLCLRRAVDGELFHHVPVSRMATGDGLVSPAGGARQSGNGTARWGDWEPYAAIASRRLEWRMTPPRPRKPSNIIVQVAGSGILQQEAKSPATAPASLMLSSSAPVDPGGLMIV